MHFKGANKLPLALAIAAVSSVVSAQQLEEVIVTAQLRAESLQDVPISVNAMSGERMQEMSITNLEKMTTYIPNFSMNQTGISSTITIRGISSGINQSFEQSVGMYNDGVYYGKAQLTRLPLFDLERVEVLRGPQPILFGKNSIAGAVSLISARPSDEFEGSVQALYEPDHNEQDYRVVLSGPLTDTFSARLSYLYREMDGWLENVASGDDEKMEEEQVVRIGALWQPNDDLSVYLKYENATFDTDGRNIETVNNIVREDLVGTGAGVDYNTAMTNTVNTLNQLITLSNAGVFAPNDPRYRSGPLIEGYVEDDAVLNDKRFAGDFDTSENEVHNVSMRIDWNQEDFTLTSITGYIQYESDETCDCDYNPAPVIDDTFLFEDYEQFSQELRISSAGGNTVDYIAGVFYQDNTLEYKDSINVPQNTLLRAINNLFGVGGSARRTFEQDTEVWAVFGQATWNIDDALRLVVGARYTDENKDGSRYQSNFNAAGVDQGSSNLLLNALYGGLLIEPNTQKGSRGEDAFTPQVTVQWDATDDVMLYATYVEGFKSGGYDNRSNADPDPAVIVPGTPPGAIGAWEFDKEEAISYEVGFKSTLADGAAELNGSFFYTEYEDLQTSVFDGGVGFNVTNAGKATIYGAEFDGRWAMTDWFTLSGSLGYLDFEFDDFDVAQCWFGAQALAPEIVTDPARGLCDFSGERKEFTPEWKGALSGEVYFPIGSALAFRSNVDVLYSDEYNYSPILDPRTIQDATTIVNARVAVSSVDESWELALIGNNLTDERTISFGGTQVLAGALTQGTGMAYYSFTNRPRYYALQGTYRF